jgi:hypothetical protein
LNQYLTNGKVEKDIYNNNFDLDDNNNNENDDGNSNNVKSMEIKSETLTGDILDYKVKILILF